MIHFKDKIKILIFFLYVSSSPVLSARILAVFPVPSISHQVVFRSLTQELARRGHDLTIITPDPVYPEGNGPKNFREIDLHDKSYAMWREMVTKKMDGHMSPIEIMELAYVSLVDVLEMQFNTKEVKELLNKEQKFDLILTEALNRPALAVSHIYKAPVIQVSSLGALYPNFHVLGAPMHPVIYPAPIVQRVHDLSIWEKIVTSYIDYRFRFFQWRLESLENDMLKRIFGDDMPNVSELNNNVDMLFLNLNPIWEDNHPVPPSVIYMGGLHQRPQKELPEDLKLYLDNSKNGVIYMSFGTNVLPSLLPSETIAVFNKVFDSLPYDVLWKWDKDTMPGQSKNVNISKWLPQSDLLRHPKVKLFITQAGLQSTDESITAGVPFLAFPVLADQWYNAEKYEKHKIGIKMDLATITEEILKKSINHIVLDKSYRENVVKFQELIQDQPQTPMERAVWWIEHVLRHGGAKHLRCPAANISWQEYYMIDVVAVLASFTITLLITLYFILRSCCTSKQKLKQS